MDNIVRGNPMEYKGPYADVNRQLLDSLRMEKLKSQIKMNQAYARALRKELNDLKKKYSITK